MGVMERVGLMTEGRGMAGGGCVEGREGREGDGWGKEGGGRVGVKRSSWKGRTDPSLKVGVVGL